MPRRSLLLTAIVPPSLAAAYAVVIYALAEDPLVDWSGILRLKIAGFLPAILMIAPVMLLGALAVDRRRGGHRSITDIVGQFVTSRLRRGYGLPFLMPLLTAAIVGTAYNIYKQRVLPRAGYGADALLANVDRALLGNDAWSISHALLPWDWFTQAVDYAYHPLFFPTTMGVALATYLPLESAARTRYALGYALLVIGPATLGSWLVPAVGPCFEAFYHGTAHFAALSDTLIHQQAAIMANGDHGLASLDYQTRLRDLFHSAAVADGAGISALPSVHNSLSTLFICFALTLRRSLAWVLLPYAALIFVGSVHLGWHYAIDGLFGITLATGVWMTTAPIVRGMGLTSLQPRQRDPHDLRHKAAIATS